MSNILIIGGNGYVGTQLYNYLDYNVDVIDTCWFGKTIEDTIVDDYKTMSKEEKRPVPLLWEKSILTSNDQTSS